MAHSTKTAINRMNKLCQYISSSFEQASKHTRTHTNTETRTSTNCDCVHRISVYICILRFSDVSMRPYIYALCMSNVCQWKTIGKHHSLARWYTCTFVAQLFSIFTVFLHLCCCCLCTCSRIHSHADGRLHVVRMIERQRVAVLT